MGFLREFLGFRVQGSLGGSLGFLREFLGFRVQGSGWEFGVSKGVSRV